MAFQKTYCSNESCPRHTEYSGGRFIYSAEKRAFFCEDCFHVPVQLNDCKELYSFVTTHLTGQPIEVKGKAHLQRLEKEHGVSHHQMNHDERNWNVPPPVRQRPEFRLP